MWICLHFYTITPVSEWDILTLRNPPYCVPELKVTVIPLLWKKMDSKQKRLNDTVMTRSVLQNSIIKSMSRLQIRKIQNKIQAIKRIFRNKKFVTYSNYFKGVFRMLGRCINMRIATGQGWQCHILQGRRCRLLLLELS